MSLASYLSWFQTPEAGRRAEAASALARAFLYGDLDAAELRGAETALTAALDDPSPVVRGALAEAMAGAEQAPRHILVALANDQPEVAAIVLSRSLALRDADLVDCVAVADGYAQAAVAVRPELSEAVCAALADFGGREACVAMSLNPGARMGPAAMARAIQRFGEDAEFREAMLARRDLPAGLRYELAVAVGRTLSAFVASSGWLAGERSERLTREARDKAAILVAARRQDESLDLARHLRRAGHLTPSLLLRALLSCERGFFASALADLADVAVARAQGLMRDPHSPGFSAVCDRAGLPRALAPAFRAAVDATRKIEADDEGGLEGRLSFPVVRAVVDACEAIGGEEMGRAMALLRRFETEAALESARADAARAIAEAERQQAEREAAERALIEEERALAAADHEAASAPAAEGEIVHAPARLDYVAAFDHLAAADRLAEGERVFGARRARETAPAVELDREIALEPGTFIEPRAIVVTAGDPESDFAPQVELRGALDDEIEALRAPMIAIDPTTLAQPDPLGARETPPRKGFLSRLSALRGRAA